MANIQKDYQDKEQVTSDLSSLFSCLTKILEKKSALHWHIESLGRYIREGINPIGLRIQIFPTLDNITKELKTNWETKLNECSKHLMLLLQNEYQQQLRGMDMEIQTLYTRLSALKKHEQYTVYEKKLKEHLEIFSKNILIKKEKKYWRDKNAFGEGRAYKWNTNSQIRKSSRFPKQNNINQTNDYLSDTPSNNSSSSASSQAGKFRGKRKGPFPKQTDMEGEIQQTHKRRTTDVQSNESTRGGREGGMGRTRGTIPGNPKGSSSQNTGKSYKEQGAIPKTQQTHIDTFLDKSNIQSQPPPTPPPQLSMISMTAPPVKEN